MGIHALNELARLTRSVPSVIGVRGGRLAPLQRLILLLLLILCTEFSRADWINLTGAETAPNIAEVYVLDDRVKVILEVYVGDLMAFEALLPDPWLRDLGVEPDLPSERLRRFSEEGLQLVTETGRRLQAEVALAEARLRTDRRSPYAGMINPVTRQPVPEAPEDKRVLYVELDYRFEDRPRSLTIVPPLDEEGYPTVDIGFITYHKSVPVIDFRYLGSGATLKLDWEDPWYSNFDNRNLKRHHKSALMSYLYVEPFEVRHEILSRVKDLEQWMDLGLRGEELIEIDELGPLKQRIGEFFLTRNTVRIDGAASEPVLERSSYVMVALTGLQLLEETQPMELSTAIVGVILTYFTEGMPQQVRVDWELFTDQIQSVPTTAVDPAGPLSTYVTVDDNVHTWNNFLKRYELPSVEEIRVAGSLGSLNVPLASLGFLLLMLPTAWWLWRSARRARPLRSPLGVAAVLLALGIASYPYARVNVDRPAVAAGNLSPEQSRQLLLALLKNVYRAFDFREEEVVYDKLALSVSGDLLADIYLQSRKSFAVQKAGGAQAKIKSVEVLEAQAERRDSDALEYALRATWSAAGRVGHWGHVHTRQNRYDGVVTVRAVDGRWKITGLELLEETRIDPSSDGAVSQASRPGRQSF